MSCPKPQPDSDVSLRFMRSIGRRTLAAINPDKDGSPPICATPEKLSAANNWISDRSDRLNIHFTVNPCKTALNRKPAETDIATFTFAHVDCDPLPGEAASNARRRHRQALNALRWQPTFIWDTGNGVAALWQIDTPIELIDEATIERCKAVNIGLIQALGGKAAGVDNCQNLDRLLRMPGTINIPGPRKRAAGRTVEVAGNVEHHPQRIYSIAKLPTATISADVGDDTTEIGEPISDYDLTNLKVPERIQTIIIHGRVPGEVKKKDDSRSAWEAEVIFSMIRAGNSNELILGILLDPLNAIGERVLEKSDPENYARKEIIRLRKKITTEIATDFGEPPDLPSEHVGKTNSNNNKSSAADQLFALSQKAEYFRNGDGAVFAHVSVDGVRQTLAVKSQTFRKWLTKTHHQSTGRVPSMVVLEDVIRAIEATADDAPKRQVRIRVAMDEGRVYIDLCNDQWEVVQIDGDGWRIIRPEELPSAISFKRSPGMLPLPKPIAGGAIGELRNFLNVELDGNEPNVDDSQFVLVVMYILACYRDGVPYPILQFEGEHGSAKTTTSEIVRSLIDPAMPMAKTLPRSEQDMYIAANASHLLAFDNVSRIPDWLSDGLCRMSTGGGFGTRMLYTDDEERLFTATRPIILNGIGSVIRRPDLMDRSVFARLKPIAKRRPKDELMTAFAEAKPRILGALFDILAHGLGAMPFIDRDSDMPRMAEFDLFSRACETHVWKAGTFRRAYDANRAGAQENILRADTVAEALSEFMMFEANWEGTATELLKCLEQVRDNHLYDKTWPGAPHHLSRRLRQIAPELRELRGLDISLGEGMRTNTTREIKITRVASRTA